MARGYDSSELFREDTILRIQHLNTEIAELRRLMEETQKEVATINEHIQSLKKEVGCIGRMNWQQSSIKSDQGSG